MPVVPVIPEDDPDKQQNQNLEILGENNGEEDADYTNLIDVWNHYKANPINLNHTTREELQDLQLLSDIQINHLLSHIEKNGKLITIFELQGIEGFDLPAIKKILPYVKVADMFSSSKFSAKEMFKEGKHEIVFRYQRILEHQVGFNSRTTAELQKTPSKYYLGSQERLYSRYRFTYGNNVSWGFIAEKDAGEPFKKIDSLKKKAGFDFYSAHLFVRNIRFVKALAIGDYQASFGQGLVMWRGFAFGKSVAISSMKRNAAGLKPYSSVDENRFLRGAATTLKFKKIETTVFYSRKKIDANVSRYDTLVSGALDPEEISSIIQTGSHTTIGELKDKKTITETIYGSNISHKGRKLQVGVTGQYFQLSTPLLKSASTYNQYDFSGKENYNVGADFSFVHKNINVFGEGAYSKNGGTAFLAGALMSLDPKVNLIAYYRNFDKKYQNLLGLAISENTLPQNERGLYLGADLKLPGFLALTVYYDQFRFPWLKFQTSSSSSGHDFFAQLNWTPDKKTDMYVRIRSRKKQENTSILDVFDYAVNVNQTNYRYNVSFQLLPYLKLRSRLEYVTYQKEGKPSENGMMIYQDVSFKKVGKPLEVSFRYGLFETDSYDTRIYAYENDVLYSFSIPAFYEKGSRVYLMVDYNITRKIELWARIGQTVFYNKNITSEGAINEINGPAKTEIKLQIRYKI